MPGKGKHLLDLPASYRLADFSAMDRQPEFADIRLAWNEAGLGLQWQIPAKTQPIYGEADRPTACDGLSLWIDSRDARTSHRASKYCQRFIFLAHNGGAPAVPQVLVRKIDRALADPPASDLSEIRLRLSSMDEDGDLAPASDLAKVSAYRMEVFLPASVLPGYDPEANRRLGVCYRVRDRELGDQLLAAGADFPYWEDPSLWSVLDLVK